MILNMKIDGELIVTLPQIEKYIIDFYKQLFATSHDKQASLYPTFWDEQFLLSDSARLALEQPFTEDELKLVVFSSNAAGAPGPNRFSFIFYQYF
jgi:hypothetical protein